MAVSTPERWLPVVGYEGAYEASDHGRVRSVDRIGGRGRKYKGRVLRPGLDSSGSHLVVALCRDGRPKTYMVHVLVMLAFVGPPPVGLEICHNDGDGTHNALTNLRYDTRSANMLDRVKHGVMVQGSRCYNAQLTESDIPEIRKRLANGESPASIASDFPVTRAAIYGIRDGRTWKHVAGEN